MQDIWFFSDPHYNHKNIVRGVTEWDNKDECRNFDTLEEHNEVIVQNINKCVKKDDIAYCLGDWSFGGRESIFEFRDKINCKNIHLILGNHDHLINKNVNVYDRTAHSLFSSINQILIKKIRNENFVLCHYSMRTWDRGHHGSIHLYGHSHGTLPDYKTLVKNKITINDEIVKEIEEERIFKCMDVGIDTHPEFRPYSYEEILQKMANRIPLRVDHHDTNTN